MDTFFRDHQQNRSSRGYGKSSGGFSLVELLVCIGIIMLISGVILARYKSFNSTLLLRDLAYEIALSIRESQVRGISVRGSSGTFTHASGIHFTTNTPTTYTLFTDLNDDEQYDIGEAVATYTIGDRKQITSLYTGVCSPTCATRPTIDILFIRPNPDALFYDGADIATFLPASSVSIVVGAPPDTNTRTIRVWSTGQVAVE